MPAAETLSFVPSPLDQVSRWLRRHARLITMIGLGLFIVGVFWIGSRYPALLAKAHGASGPLASMAFSHEAIHSGSHDSLILRILFGSLNWLSSMAIGMTFGIAFGALLHTVLRYHPLHVSQNLTLNTLKGALVGVPMGVCGQLRCSYGMRSHARPGPYRSRAGIPV